MQQILAAKEMNVRRELGVRLMERSNGITGSATAGQVLLEEARLSGPQAEPATRLSYRADAASSLRIGFVANAVRHLMPALVMSFRASRPDIPLKLTEMTTARLVAALLDEKLDIGVVTLPLPPSTNRRIATRTLTRDHLVAAIPAQHALASTPTISLASLANEPWVLFPEDDGRGLHGCILVACARAGFTPRVTQQAVQVETIVGFVAAGHGVALVPSQFMNAGFQGVAFRPLDAAGEPVSYENALAWRRDQRTQVVRAFLASSRRLSMHRDSWDKDTEDPL